MRVHQWTRQWTRRALGLIGAASLAVLVTCAATPGAAHAFTPDFTTWVAADKDWYYPANRLHVTAHIMDQNFSESPGVLSVRFDPAYKGVVVVDENLSSCTRSYTPAGQMFSGTWFHCSFSAVTNNTVRFYAVAPDRTGRFNITTIASTKGTREPDADESDNSSFINLLIANP